MRIGDKVIYINNENHQREPDKYPAEDTEGTIIDVEVTNTVEFYVQWPAGSTSGDDKQYAYPCDLELVDEKEEVK